MPKVKRELEQAIFVQGAVWALAVMTGATVKFQQTIPGNGTALTDYVTELSKAIMSEIQGEAAARFPDYDQPEPTKASKVSQSND